MKTYYSGFCDICHDVFDHVTRCQKLVLTIKHKHLISAILHSYAVFVPDKEVDVK